MDGDWSKKDLVIKKVYISKKRKDVHMTKKIMKIMAAWSNYIFSNHVIIYLVII